MTFPLMPTITPTSRTGENWDDIGNASYGDLRAIASGAAGQIMIGAENLDVLYSTTYGASIATKNVQSGTAPIYGVAYGAGLYVVANESTSQVFSSADGGDSWTQRITGSLDNHAVNFNDGYFIIGTGAEGGRGYINFSTNGTTWLGSPPTGANSCQCGIYVESLNRTFAAGVAAQAKYRNNRPPYSANGDTWTGDATGLTGVIYNVAWSPSLGIAVCVGTGGVFSSYSMIGWTRQSTIAMQSVAWCGDVFVAVGPGGRIMTSVDGLTWRSETSGTTEALYGVCYTGGTVFASGDNGVILRSS